MTVENLNIFVANTLADVEPLNENFEILRLALNSSDTSVGTLSDLRTSQKSTIVGAINSLKTELTEIINLIIPVGLIIPHASSADVNGFLLCDGRAVSRATYAKLFSIIGTTYGAGNGDTTFNLPDFRGSFLQGYGGTSLAIGQKQEAGLPNITGWLNACTDGASGAFLTNTKQSYGTGDYDFWDVTFDASRVSSVYGKSTTVTPQNFAVYYHIKY